MVGEEGQTTGTNYQGLGSETWGGEGRLGGMPSSSGENLGGGGGGLTFFQLREIDMVKGVRAGGRLPGRGIVHTLQGSVLSSRGHF